MVCGCVCACVRACGCAGKWELCMYVCEAGNLKKFPEFVCWITISDSTIIYTQFLPNSSRHQIDFICIYWDKDEALVISI